MNNAVATITWYPTPAREVKFRKCTHFEIGQGEVNFVDVHGQSTCLMGGAIQIVEESVKS